MLCDADPGTITPDTQLDASQLINISVPTAPKITPKAWVCIPEILSWASYPVLWRLLHSLGTDVNGDGFLSWMKPVPGLTDAFYAD